MIGAITILPKGTIKRIHVNQHNLRANTKTGANLPVYTVKNKGKTYTGHTVNIHGPSFLPEPGKPLACGARAWVETEEIVTLWTNLPWESSAAGE